MVTFTDDLREARSVIREYAEELVQRTHNDATIAQAEHLMDLADRLTPDRIPSS